ncbi:glutaminyl-peptide cyclotransferase, partial [candidate division KSB1 bacterium]|nr:glutaminyl-peptide cyclotransferase [candidate division KSB1 bacterium]
FFKCKLLYKYFFQKKWALILLAMFFFFMEMKCSRTSPTNPEKEVDGKAWQVVKSFPHDTLAFTQGLLVRDGFFYESTGLYGKSSLRKIKISTGEILQIQSLPANIFAEGLAFDGMNFVQLTWLNGIGYIYEPDSFSLKNTFAYKRQGWGITYDGHFLIMSDGSDSLFYWDPISLIEIKALGVTFDGVPIEHLNELEFIDNQIWANIWKSDSIAIINPGDGIVATWLDMSGILSAGERTATADVMNGIAWDEITNAIFITGKLWPKVYQIQLPESQ